LQHSSIAAMQGSIIPVINHPSAVASGA
jgi:hypothetical protein